MPARAYTFFRQYLVGRMLPLAILLLAAALRLIDLGSRAFHHDESIHALTATYRLSEFVHIYDPVYHGPFLYYANALVYSLFGISDVSARLLPALAGIALVAVVPWLFGRQLGRYGTALAMLFLAISPAFLYYSRFLRNDIYIALVTMLAMGALIRYVERPQRRWLLLAASALGLGLVIKENTYIVGFIFVTFLLLLWSLAAWFRPQIPVSGGSGRLKSINWAFSQFFGDWVGLLAAVSILVAIPALFFTSFLQNTSDLWRSVFDSVAVWSQVHESGRVNQPWFYYLLFAILLEPTAAVLGLAGIVSALRRIDVFGGLLLWWLLLSFFIYSIAGEKAAWLTLHPLLPLILLSARFGGQSIGKLRGRELWLLGVSIALLTALTLRHSIPSNFLYGDVPRTPLVYTQTSPDIADAIELIETAGLLTGVGHELPIFADSISHWPLAWYLRDYSNVYYGSGAKDVRPGRSAIMFLGISTSAELELNVEISGYQRQQIHLREWFPEWIYGDWNLGSVGSLITNGDHIGQAWGFLAFHNPPAPIGSTDLYLFIRSDLIELGIRPNFTR